MEESLASTRRVVGRAEYEEVDRDGFWRMWLGEIHTSK